MPQYAHEKAGIITQNQNVQTVSLVPMAITVDVADMKFNAAVVLEGHFPQNLYLRGKELRCYNIGRQGAYGETCINERASLVLAFGDYNQSPIRLFGMIDTGSGVNFII